MVVGAMGETLGCCSVLPKQHIAAVSAAAIAAAAAVTTVPTAVK